MLIKTTNRPGLSNVGGLQDEHILNFGFTLVITLLGTPKVVAVSFALKMNKK